jgi:hypothetical protein
MACQQGRKSDQRHNGKGIRRGAVWRRRCTACSIGTTALHLRRPPPKTTKACRDEWRANKDTNQTKGIAEKAYVTQCRAGGRSRACSHGPAARSNENNSGAPQPAATTGTRTAATTPTGANQYSTEGQARFRCGGGTVVWANLDSKIYHFTGHKEYGKTKAGAYMCEQDATTQGMRAAKNEKHP